MIQYLVYSSLCSGLMLLVYKLFLEKERMHRFKRVYLLLAIIFSFVVPCLVVQETVVPGMVTKQSIQTESMPTAHVHQINSASWQLVAVCVFSIVSVLFFIRFVYNLYKFTLKIKAGKRRNYRNAILVLHEEDQVPHSFLHYIFISKAVFDNNEMEKEILHHELAHVIQRHSYDILFIELTLCILWWNPFHFYYKKCIQLNHEFLADESVINSFGNIQSYQRLLLEKLSGHTMISIVSRFDFGVTKKRLLMMGKRTPRKIILYKQLMMLPVVMISVYLFGQHIEVKERSVNIMMELATINNVADSNAQKAKPVSVVKNKPHIPKGKSTQLSPLTTRLTRLESLSVKQEAGLNRLSPLSSGKDEVEK